METHFSFKTIRYDMVLYNKADYIETVRLAIYARWKRADLPGAGYWQQSVAEMHDPGQLKYRSGYA